MKITRDERGWITSIPYMQPYFAYKDKFYGIGTVLVTTRYLRRLTRTYIGYNQFECQYEGSDEKFIETPCPFGNMGYGGEIVKAVEYIPPEEVPQKTPFFGYKKYGDGAFAVTVWYIVGMVVATIFKGNWMLWILFTILYINWRRK